MSFIKDLVKSSKNPNIQMADDGVGEITGYIDTGSYILNAQISGSIFGGIPNNRVTAFNGDPGVGKTFFILNVVNKFLSSDQNANVIYFESENAISTQMLKDRGIDTSRVAIYQVVTVQDFRNQVMHILEEYESIPQNDRQPLMICLDSLGNLSTNKELEDAKEGKDTRDMTKAQIIKSAFRVITLKSGRLQVPISISNHCYNLIGSYVPTKVGAGGTGLTYAASIIVLLSKTKDREGKEVVGNIITSKLEKGRLTKEQTKVQTMLSFKYGLHPYYGLLELGEKYDVFKKSGHRYELPNGEKVFAKAMLSSPKKYFTDDVMNQLDDAAKKEFKFGNEQEDFGLNENA